MLLAWAPYVQAKDVAIAAGKAHDAPPGSAENGRNRTMPWFWMQGKFMLSDGLSLDVNEFVRGAGMDRTVLDFTGQMDAGEGLLVTSDGVTLRDFALENPKGDSIKSKGADNIVYHRVRVTWTGGPSASNGAYGIYSG